MVCIRTDSFQYRLFANTFILFGASSYGCCRTDGLHIACYIHYTTTSALLGCESGNGQASGSCS